MKFTAKQYACALYDNLENNSTDNNKQISDFLKILKKNRQFNIINKVVIELEKLIKIKNNILEIEAVSAVKIDEQELKDKLEKKLNKKVVLKSKIDQKIIAGLILKINDMQIDGSVKTQLKLLNNKLINN